jgi:hypothetical protein
MKPLTSIDSHTVPSSYFTRPSTNTETVSPPPYHTNDTYVFSRTPYAYQRNLNSNSTNETLARQTDVSTMNGNDISSTNGQLAIRVKDTKVVPSTEFVGLVTRAKDG